jgi:hypothetical protein
MAAIEEKPEHVDEWAQDVVNACGQNMLAGNATFLTDDFKAVFDKALCYRSAKSVADNRREFNVLSEQDAAEEELARRAFAEAYKVFWEKHQVAAS